MSAPASLSDGSAHLSPGNPVGIPATSVGPAPDQPGAPAPATPIGPAPDVSGDPAPDAPAASVGPASSLSGGPAPDAPVDPAPLPGISAVELPTTLVAGTSRVSGELYADELTAREVEALFAEQEGRAATAKRPVRSAAPAFTGSPAVMGEDDMTRLLATLGEEADKAQAGWLPAWAKTPATPTGARYTEEDVFAPANETGWEETPPGDGDSDLLRKVEDLGIAVGTIDDTTVEARDAIRDLKTETETLREQMEVMAEDVTALKHQNATLLEEVRSLRGLVLALRGHFATLVRQLAAPPPGAG
jgi:hypothetical protein